MCKESSAVEINRFSNSFRCLPKGVSGCVLCIRDCKVVSEGGVIIALRVCSIDGPVVLGDGRGVTGGAVDGVVAINGSAGSGPERNEGDFCGG